MSKHLTVTPPLPAQQTNQVISVIAPLLTTLQAAAYLSVKPATLEQWRWNGSGPRFVKIGRSVRYRQTDLDAFAEEHTFSSTTEAQKVA